jgi:hypothetical protein
LSFIKKGTTYNGPLKFKFKVTNVDTDKFNGILGSVGVMYLITGGEYEIYISLDNSIAACKGVRLFEVMALKDE